MPRKWRQPGAKIWKHISLVFLRCSSPLSSPIPITTFWVPPWGWPPWARELTTCLDSELTLLLVSSSPALTLWLADCRRLGSRSAEQSSREMWVQQNHDADVRNWFNSLKTTNQLGKLAGKPPWLNCKFVALLRPSRLSTAWLSSPAEVWASVCRTQCIHLWLVRANKRRLKILISRGRSLIVD